MQDIMNQSNTFCELWVFEASIPKFSLKVNNQPNKFLPKIRIFYIKLSNFYGVSQKILLLDLRIPESQDLFRGLSYWFHHYHGVETPFPLKSQNLCLDLAPIMCLVCSHIEEEELYFKCNDYVILQLINFTRDENLCINTIKAGGGEKGAHWALEVNQVILKNRY